MPIHEKSLRHYGARRHRVHRLSSLREPRAPRKLGTSHHLIAPAHTLTLPSLEGVKSSFESSHGFEAAVPPARVLVRKGLLNQKHLTDSGSAVAALDKALSDIVGNASASGGKDAFDVEIHLMDQRGGRNALRDLCNPTVRITYIGRLITVPTPVFTPPEVKK